MTFDTQLTDCLLSEDKEKSKKQCGTPEKERLAEV